MVKPYGNIVFKRDFATNPDGSIFIESTTITSADDRVGVGTEFISLGDIPITEDGYLKFDQFHIYKPVCFDKGGRVTICERVRD